MKNLETPETVPALALLEAKISKLFAEQLNHRHVVARRDVKERIKVLHKLHDTLLAFKDEFRQSLYLDFNKNPAEVDLSEIYPLVTEIKHTISHLKGWLSPQKVKTPLPLLGSDSYILLEPKGVVLIISPWNFPVNLTLSPLISAIAAGNCVFIKPSELTPHTSAVIRRMMESIFDPNEVYVFEGDHNVSTALLNRPFHHIFFTGGPEIGKVVMKAAAKNLASVTLELGGKSPVIVDETANLHEAAKKIVWGKFFNNGQTCIAPDYILVAKSKEKELISLMMEKIKAAYGSSEEERARNKDYNRIVNVRHFRRVQSLLEDALAKGAQLHIGGKMNEEERYIAPTIVSNVDLNSPLMQQEIFGPLLPIISYGDLEEALRLVNSKDKPLALYIYSQNKKTIKEVIDRTSSGGTCINDNVIHFFQPNLPFGGSNHSGIGKAHGIFGLKAFSNERAVLRQRTRWSSVQLMFPPYTPLVRKLIEFCIRWL